MRIFNIGQLHVLSTALAYCVHGPNEGVSYQSNSSIFTDLVDTSIPALLVTNETLFAEGPICLPDGTLIFSEVWRNRAVSWTEEEGIKVIASPSDFQNGHSVDPQGRVVAACEGKRGIVRREFDGQWVTLVDSYEGKPLNAPDDVVVSSDGNIWFSDPGFGLRDIREGYGGQQEQDGLYFYRYDPNTDEIIRLDTPGMRLPNGLAFSPDESLLYLTDTNTTASDDYIPRKIFVYDVDQGNIKNGRLFKQTYPGVPDGIRVDEHGNVWSSTREGVHIYTPQGELLGKILIESLTSTSNLAFGKDKQGKKWLYVVATTRVLRIGVKVDGSTARWLDKAGDNISQSSYNVSKTSTSASIWTNATSVPTVSPGTAAEKSSGGPAVANVASNLSNSWFLLMLITLAL